MRYRRSRKPLIRTPKIGRRSKKPRSKSVRRRKNSRIKSSRRSKKPRSKSIRRRKNSRIKSSRRSKKLRIVKHKNFKMKETIDDGNCFFSSIYRSMNDYGLLDKLYTCFPKLKSSSEVSFMKRLRSLIATKSTDDIKNMFVHFSTLDVDSETFEEITDSLGSISEVLNEFYQENKFKKKYGKEFIKEIQKSIKTDMNWVSEIEVSSFKKILEDECNIFLKTFNNRKVAVEKIKNDIKNTQEGYDNSVYLLNISESHWVYI